jgi:ABC-type amino acid transport/signal transduction systems, periplasmic component/domain
MKEIGKVSKGRFKTVFLCALSFLFFQQAQAQDGSGVVKQLPAAAASQPIKKKLIVAVYDGPPWSMKDDDGQWTGLTVQLWREIALLLDLDYEFKEYDVANLQAALDKGEVDLSAGGLAITTERESKFDFSVPYFIMSQSVAVNADQQPSVVQVITSTLSTSDILKCLFLILLVSLTGALILWLSEKKGNSELYTGRDLRSFGRAIYWSVMVLANREPVTPNSYFARLFEVLWVLVGIVLISLFTASAASLFTARQLQSVVTSSEDLHKTRVGTVQGCAAQKILDHRAIKYIAYETPTELIKALTKHHVDAAVMAGATSSYYSKQLGNKIMVLGFSLRQDFAAIPMPAGSPLRKPINRAILEILDTTRWKKITSEFVPHE